MDAISTMSRLDAKDNPYVQYPSASASPNAKIYKTWEVLDRYGKRFENNTRSIKAAADNVWNHLKLSSSVTDAAMVRLCRGTKLLTEGGYEKVFQQTFGFVDGDKYLDSFACYLSTSSGPVNGTLYISTKRVAFYSEFPLCHYPSPGSHSGFITRDVLVGRSLEFLKYALLEVLGLKLANELNCKISCWLPVLGLGIGASSKYVVERGANY